MRRSSQSAQEYSLLLGKPHTVNKNSDTPKLGHKKLVIAFQIAVTVDVKIIRFGRQVAVCITKRHTNAMFRCSWFQKFNFDCLLIKLLICSLKTEIISSFVCPLQTQSLDMISRTQIYFTFFLALSHKSWR